MGARRWRELAGGWVACVLAMLWLGAMQARIHAGLDAVFNHPLLWKMHGWHAPLLDKLMRAATVLGTGWVVASGLLALCLLLRSRAARLRAVWIVAGTAAITGVGKVLVDSHRPRLWIPLERVSGSSFPSSHASASLALALAIVLLVPREWRMRIAPPVLVLALLVAVSRIYLGVHYPSDILLTWPWVLAWTLWVQRCFAESPLSPRVSMPASPTLGA